MNRSQRIRKMTGVACLTAVVVVLQLVANYISFGAVNINLSLIPIVIGAIMFGPTAGAFLGAVNGVIVITAPATLSIFMTVNPIGTIITCLGKTALAGYVSGLLFNLVSKKNVFAGTIVASVVVPIINTLVYCLCVIVFFPSLLESDGMTLIITTIVSTNFVLELVVNSVLSPTIYYIVKTLQKRKK